MGPYAGVDFNLTLCKIQSGLQHIYHGELYARVDLNPMPESTFSPGQGPCIWPLSTARLSIYNVSLRRPQNFLRNLPLALYDR